MIRVYICHPFGANPVENAEKCRQICEAVVKATADAPEGADDFLPIAPQIFLGQFIDDATQREYAMRCCLSLVDMCEEMWVMGDVLSPGMRQELEHAISAGDCTVRFFTSVKEMTRHIKSYEAEE